MIDLDKRWRRTRGRSLGSAVGRIVRPRSGARRRGGVLGADEPTGDPELHGARSSRRCGARPVPSVGFNGESWFLARAFPLVASEKGVRGIVSYADPLERTTIAGELMKRQHWGTIYQATNAVYAGRSAPRWLVLAPDGTVVSGRSLSKIRLMERGWEYAMRQLLAYGAPPREWGEAPADWLQRALASPVFRRVRHPGNLAYVFGTDRAAMRRWTRSASNSPSVIERSSRCARRTRHTRTSSRRSAVRRHRLGGSPLSVAGGSRNSSGGSGPPRRGRTTGSGARTASAVSRSRPCVLRRASTIGSPKIGSAWGL